MELATAIELVLKNLDCGVVDSRTNEAFEIVTDYLDKTYKNLRNQKIRRCKDCEDFEIQFTGSYCKNWKTYVDGKGCFYGRKIRESK